MKVVFNTASKQDLRKARKYYAAVSQRRVDEFNDQVKAVIRTIVQRRGGDHIGPHGFSCRRCSPFPYLVYYRIRAEIIDILGLVHERRHPNYLQRRLVE